ncbi:MAG: hypothetical protein QOE61_7087 [Micromonosporaceae bacterium]|nr:hypothetical protein [Micromonosporaceae bacterium]
MPPTGCPHGPRFDHCAVRVQSPPASKLRAILSVVHIRSPGVPEEPSGDDHARQPHFADDSIDAVDGNREIVRHPDGSVRFAVPTRIIIGKLAAAAVVAIAALVAPNRAQLLVGLIAAVGLGIYGLRDVLARERLRADPDGIVAVHGFAGHDRLAWTDVERVRLDSRDRLGARSQLLEIDAGEHIYLYSRFDLGVDPDEAVIALESVRAG